MKKLTFIITYLCFMGFTYLWRPVYASLLFIGRANNQTALYVVFALNYLLLVFTLSVYNTNQKTKILVLFPIVSALFDMFIPIPFVPTILNSLAIFYSCKWNNNTQDILNQLKDLQYLKQKRLISVKDFSLQEKELKKQYKVTQKSETSTSVFSVLGFVVLLLFVSFLVFDLLKSILVSDTPSPNHIIRKYDELRDNLSKSQKELEKLEYFLDEMDD